MKKLAIVLALAGVATGAAALRQLDATVQRWLRAAYRVGLQQD
jgi:hypothetical protein